MSNTTVAATTARRPYFQPSKWFSTPEGLSLTRLTELEDLRKQALFYEKKNVACPPAYQAVMTGIAKEISEMQNKIAEMIASAECLAELFEKTENQVCSYETDMEENGEASEEFTVTDAMVIVSECEKKIADWEY